MSSALQAATLAEVIALKGKPGAYDWAGVSHQFGHPAAAASPNTIFNISGAGFLVAAWSSSSGATITIQVDGGTIYPIYTFTGGVIYPLFIRFNTSLVVKTNATPINSTNNSAQVVLD